MPLTPVEGMWSMLRPRLYGVHLKLSCRESVLKRNIMPDEWCFDDLTPPFTLFVTFDGRRS